MIVPMFVVGLAASVLTEILKLFPVLSSSKERKRILAFVIALVFGIIYVLSEPKFTSEDGVFFVVGTLSATFVIYKSIVQPVRSVKRKK